MSVPLYRNDQALDYSPMRCVYQRPGGAWVVGSPFWSVWIVCDEACAVECARAITAYVIENLASLARHAWN